MSDIRNAALKALMEEDPSMTVGSIAKKHGYDYSWITARYPELCQKRTDFIKTLSEEEKKQMRAEAKAKGMEIERSCLSCSKKFITNNKFIRLCDDCKGGDRYMPNDTY